MAFKLGAILLIIIMLSCTMSGCLHKQELGDIALLLGAALDADGEGGLLLTVEAAHQPAAETAGESMLFTARGADLDQLETELERQLERYPYWGNMAVVVFGSNLSQRQITEAALHFYGDKRIGPGILLLQTAGTAAEVLEGDFGEADYVAMGLAQAVEREYEQSRQPRPTAAAYLEALLKDKAAPSLPLATVDEAGEVRLEENLDVR